MPSRLTVIGAEEEDVKRWLPDPELLRSIDVRGRVSEEELWAELHAADVLCAPSLSGESFGMVLTEAFAAGTPVIASAIAGYSDVVTDGVDGLLVPPGDPQRLAEELQRVAHEPQRLAAMGAAARHSAKRYAWPRIADQVTTVYERAMAAPQPSGAAERAAHWPGLRPADGNRPIPPQKLPSLDPAPAQEGQPRPPHRPPRRARRRRHARRLPHLGGAEDRRRRSRRKHRPLRPQLGPRRLRPDVDLDVLPRRVLVLDRTRRPAGPGRSAAATSPRRR